MKERGRENLCEEVQFSEDTHEGTSTWRETLPRLLISIENSLKNTDLEKNMISRSRRGSGNEKKILTYYNIHLLELNGWFLKNVPTRDSKASRINEIDETRRVNVEMFVCATRHAYIHVLMSLFMHARDADLYANVFHGGFSRHRRKKSQTRCGTQKAGLGPNFFNSRARKLVAVNRTRNDS